MNEHLTNGLKARSKGCSNFSCDSSQLGKILHREARFATQGQLPLQQTKFLQTTITELLQTTTANSSSGFTKSMGSGNSGFDVLQRGKNNRLAQLMDARDKVSIPDSVEITLETFQNTLAVLFGKCTEGTSILAKSGNKTLMLPGMRYELDFLGRGMI